MKSRATSRFWTAYNALPQDIQKRARQAYTVFCENPDHPSLRFKRIHGSEPIYSVRVTRSYRALGLLEDSEITWFWIGTHSDYDRLLATL